MKKVRRRLLLLTPLMAFLLVFFAGPMAGLLSRSVREVEVPRALPGTIAALEGWRYGNPLPPHLFTDFAQDLVTAKADGTLANAARRLNYEIPGLRTTIMRAAKKVEAAPEGTQYDSAFFAEFDSNLASPEFFAVVQRSRGPVSAFYLLSAFDLQRDFSGSVQWVPQEYRIYIDVLFRTLLISGSVTLGCVLLGFPLAYLLTSVSEKAADWLIVLVLLPFWTSLLVRTAGWVVLLQREGLINKTLIDLGVLSEPLTLLYNRTGVLISMTHVLLPFMILPLYGVLKGIPPLYMKAAASLGAGPVTRFFWVYLPLAAPGLVAGGLMVFIQALGYYITPALVGGASDQMLSFFVASYTTDTGNWGMAATLGLIMLILTLVLYVIAQRLSGGRSQLAG
jgi:putative spermidine/putrescine transport system permease protein